MNTSTTADAQREDHFVDGVRDEHRWHRTATNHSTPAREACLQFVHARLDRRRPLRAHSRPADSSTPKPLTGWLSSRTSKRVVLQAELDARDVLEPHAGAVGLRAQDDVLEFFDGAETAFGAHRRGDLLPWHRRLLRRASRWRTARSGRAPSASTSAALMRKLRSLSGSARCASNIRTPNWSASGSRRECAEIGSRTCDGDDVVELVRRHAAVRRAHAQREDEARVHLRPPQALHHHFARQARLRPASRGSASAPPRRRGSCRSRTPGDAARCRWNSTTT